jgi:hypothetical protein
MVSKEVVKMMIKEKTFAELEVETRNYKKSLWMNTGFHE